MTLIRRRPRTMRSRFSTTLEGSWIRAVSTASGRRLFFDGTGGAGMVEDRMGEISTRRKSGSDAVSHLGMAPEPVGDGWQPPGAGTRKARPAGKRASYLRACRGGGRKRSYQRSQL